MLDEMKRDIEKLKFEAAALRGTDKRIAMSLIRLEEKMDRFTVSIVDTVKGEISVMKRQLDDFTTEVQASRRERALQDKNYWFLKERLDDHQSRLDKIHHGGKS